MRAAMLLGTRTSTLPAPLLASTVLIPLVPPPSSTVTFPAPVLALTPRFAALSGRTTSILPPPVSAETWVMAMPARSSLTLPPPLCALISDETAGFRWMRQSVSPLHAAQGMRKEGRRPPAALSVKVVWPLLVITDGVGQLWFSRYSSVPPASTCSLLASLSIARFPVPASISIVAVVAPPRGSARLWVSTFLAIATTPRLVVLWIPDLNSCSSISANRQNSPLP